jgi:hypothetical protein
MQVASQDLVAAERKHRIYGLKGGLEHTLFTFSSAFARYRMRVSLARRNPQHSLALLKSDLHISDGKITYPGTTKTIYEAVDYLYVAEVCVSSSPFITDAREYFGAVSDALASQQPCLPQKQQQFRLFLEVYAYYYFGSKAYIAAAKQHLGSDGICILKSMKEYVVYIRTLCEACGNPYHALARTCLATGIMYCLIYFISYGRTARIYVRHPETKCNTRCGLRDC